MDKPLAWIKLRADLPIDPRVVAIQERLGIADVDVLVGKLVRFWQHVTLHTKEGFLLGVNHAAIDAIARQPGLAAAMVEKANWLEFTNLGCQVCNFGDHLSDDAKLKAVTPTKGKSMEPTPPPANDLYEEVFELTNEPTKEEKKRLKARATATAHMTMTRAFDQFWKLYPRKVKKFGARAVWIRIAPDPELVKKILEAVKRQRTWPEWTRDDGKWIPHPKTWLNGEEWENEPTVIVVPPPPGMSIEERRARVVEERRAARLEQERIEAERAARRTPPPPVEEYEDVPETTEHTADIPEAFSDE